MKRTVHHVKHECFSYSSNVLDRPWTFRDASWAFQVFKRLQTAENIYDAEHLWKFELEYSDALELIFEKVRIVVRVNASKTKAQL